MSFSLAIFLGMVQGLAEFLPVSSSGHLVLLQKIFGIDEPPIFFNTLVHLGTLLAVLLFFGRELGKVERAKRVLKEVTIGTIPVAVVGFLVQPLMEKCFGNLILVGLGFLVTSALLFWSKKLDTGLKGIKEIKGLKDSQILMVGFFQALALVPGVSRSGTTIVGGLAQKLDRESSFKFSFYLSVPAIIGANILQLKDLSQVTFLREGLLGMLAAFVVGYLSLKVLQKILRAKKLYYFSFYCLVISLLTFFKILF